MITASRRAFIGGLAAAIAAPYVVRSGILMPIKQVLLPVRGTTTEVLDSDGAWKALAYINLKEGHNPNYRGAYPTIFDYARSRFREVRVVFGINWSPRGAVTSYGGGIEEIF